MFMYLTMLCIYSLEVEGLYVCMYVCTYVGWFDVVGVAARVKYLQGSFINSPCIA